jgi:hypothetical protein
MKPNVLVLVLAILPLLWLAPGGAQELRPISGLSLAQAERAAVDLKQGMSADDVLKLLGKPQRTALKGNGGYGDTSVQGTLQWTYSWVGTSKPGNLHIEFSAKTSDQWYVSSWEWGNF